MIRNMLRPIPWALIKLKLMSWEKKTAFPRLPQWASPKCGVPEWTIKALARDWAKKVVSIAHYFAGGMTRGPYSHEPARLEVSCWACRDWANREFINLRLLMSACRETSSAVQAIWVCLLNFRKTRPGRDYLNRIRLLLPPGASSLFPRLSSRRAIKSPPVDFWGTGAHEIPVADQFKKYTYPIPKEEGGTEFHMIWTDSPCRTTCWNCGNDIEEAIRDPKIECIVAQHPWLENDCLSADIILPGNTTMEVEDIMPCIRQGDSFQSLLLMKQAMSPIGESRSDFESVCEVANKLGKLEDVTEGKTVEELEKIVFNSLSIDDGISWEEFKEKGYYVIPVAKDWEKDPAGFSNSTRTLRPIPCLLLPASWSSIPRALLRTSRLIQRDRLSPSG